MKYEEQLKTENWDIKRKIILTRDNHECQICYNNNLLEFYKQAIFKKIDSQIFIDVASFKEFGAMYTSHLNISYKAKSILEGINNNSIVVYKVDNDWINIVGLRPLSQNENKHYSDKKNYSIAGKTLVLVTSGFNTLSKNEQAALISSKINTELNETPMHTKIIECLDKKNWQFFKSLHIHHKYYQQNKFAWEYPDDALITECWICHEELHKTEKIECRDANGKIIGMLNPCLRCYGAGYFPEYHHIYNGICFRCNGHKYEEFIEKR